MHYFFLSPQRPLKSMRNHRVSKSTEKECCSTTYKKRPLKEWGPGRASSFILEAQEMPGKQLFRNCYIKSDEILKRK